MNESSKKRRILEYMSGTPAIPDEIRSRFEKWAVDNSDDPQTDMEMFGLWESVKDSAWTEADDRVLARVKSSIRREKMKVIGRKVLGYAAAVAVVVASFAAGRYAVSKSEPLKEITLVTADGHVGEFELPDGSHVWLNGDSRLSYMDGMKGKTRDVRIDGEAYFEVKKDPSRPFRVGMEELQVEVLGTSFDAINCKKSRSETVVLKTGSVKVSGTHIGTEMELKPGEKLSVDRLTEKVTVEKVEATNWCQWFEARLQLDNAPLDDIIINIERRYNVEIKLAPGVRKDRNFSLVLGHEPVEEVMGILSMIMGTDYEIKGNKIWITNENQH